MNTHDCNKKQHGQQADTVSQLCFPLRVMDMVSVSKQKQGKTEGECMEETEIGRIRIKANL